MKEFYEIVPVEFRSRNDHLPSAECPYCRKSVAVDTLTPKPNRIGASAFEVTKCPHARAKVRTDGFLPGVYFTNQYEARTTWLN